jgi:hypothetical protein
MNSGSKAYLKPLTTVSNTYPKTALAPKVRERYFPWQHNRDFPLVK